MKMSVTVEGMRALDEALGELPKATGRSTLQRVLRQAGQPIAAAAAALAPRDTGELASSIAVSTRFKNTVGSAEFASVIRSGGSAGQAAAAMRDARRGARSAGQIGFAQVAVGPTKARTKRAAIKRIVQEFGSETQLPQPYMRPAWEENKGRSLDIIRDNLGNEIEKSAQRLARKRARALALVSGS